jgi:hypothetical protein
MLLHLKGHCIETAAKQERRRIVSTLLELDESSQRFSQLAEDLELLTGFLESSDFRRIRSERPELSGGRDLRVELRRDAEPGAFVLNVVEALPEETE